MDRLFDVAVIKSLLERHGLRLSHSLGQNFLVNPSVCPKMAALCGAAPDTGVLEVGPGIGVLTAELGKAAGKVVSVELDRRLLPVLAETLAEYGNVRIVNGDILKLDLRELLRTEFAGMRTVVCANLPDYITSPVIMRLLEERLPIDAVTVMVQKEAAARLCASPGERECGAVSVAVHYFSEPEILFPVGRGSFYPPPNVDSAVIRLTIRKSPPVQVESEPEFFRLVKAAFGQRRKTALNSVAAGLGLPKETVAKALALASLPEKVRAEALSLPQLAAFSNALSRSMR